MVIGFFDSHILVRKVTRVTSTCFCHFYTLTQDPGLSYLIQFAFRVSHFAIAPRICDMA